MSNKIIDGKLISSEIREKVKKFGDQLKSKTGKVPGLAVVLVGENPASRVYVKNKIEKTIEVGFNSIEHKLSEKVSENESNISEFMSLPTPIAVIEIAPAIISSIIENPFVEISLLSII